MFRNNWTACFVVAAIDSMRGLFAISYRKKIRSLDHVSITVKIKVLQTIIIVIGVGTLTSVVCSLDVYNWYLYVLGILMMCLGVMLSYGSKEQRIPWLPGVVLIPSSIIFRDYLSNIHYYILVSCIALL